MILYNRSCHVFNFLLNIYSRVALIWGKKIKFKNFRFSWSKTVPMHLKHQHTKLFWNLLKFRGGTENLKIWNYANFYFFIHSKLILLFPFTDAIEYFLQVKLMILGAILNIILKIYAIEHNINTINKLIKMPLICSLESTCVHMAKNIYYIVYRFVYWKKNAELFF